MMSRRSSVVYLARRTLVDLAKSTPFVLTFIVSSTYMESLYALSCGDFLVYDSYATLNTPMSFSIATNLVEYDWQVVAILTVMSYALGTCRWNKMCVLYIGIQLLEKKHLSNIELDEQTIYYVITANLVVSLSLSIKGMEILIHNMKRRIKKE